MKRPTVYARSIVLLLLGAVGLVLWQSKEEAKPASTTPPVLSQENRPQAAAQAVEFHGIEAATAGAEAPQSPTAVTSMAHPAQSIHSIADFTPETAAEDLPVYVTHARPITLNAEDLPTTTTKPGTRVRLNLFGQTSVTVQWLWKEIHSSNNIAWCGRVLEDPLSAVTLTKVGDYTIVDVQSPKFGQYELKAQDGHPGELRQFDATKINRGCPGGVVSAGFGVNGAPEETPEVAEAGPLEVAAAVTPVTIDVLMVYTTKAMQKAGSRSAIVAKAQSAVNGENSNYVRSDIAHRVRLVQAYEVGHTSSGNLPTELGWVAGNSTVATARNNAGADIVAFLSETDTAGVYGIAYQLTSTGGNSGQVYSANFWDTVGGVWPHEVGHNLGCQHNDPGVYSYSSGHYWTDSSNGTQYGSVMSYIGSRVPYFSNPDVQYSGENTGSSSHNNALSINNIGDNVAGYKTAKTLIEPSCSVTASTTKPLEGADFTITVTSKNNGPDTATACKITVTLPSKLTLVSHDGGTAFNTTTKVWDVPDYADNVTRKLVLTVRLAAGAAGISQTTSAAVTSIGSGFVDFDLYNNTGSVTVAAIFPASENPMLHYRLDQISGNTATDAAASLGGAQNATTTYAAPLWQPTGGRIGGALRFTPTAQADVAQAFSYDAPGAIISGYPFTIALWLRATPGTWYQVCAMLGDPTTGGSYFELSMNNSQASAMARNTTNSGVSATSPSTLAVADDQWHHLAGVFTSPTLRTLYVDGVPVATNTTSVSFVPNNTRFSIGALMRDVPTQSFPGHLDDIGLWNIALSEYHIALIHALGRHSGVDLDDPAIATLLAVDTAQSGFARAGDLVWVPAAGLAGAKGTTGLNNQGQPFVVLHSDGRGVVALTIPELTLQQSASDTISLSWHSGFSDWILQESSDLSAGSWFNSALPSQDSGLLRSVDYPMLDVEKHFFRLKAPMLVTTSIASSADDAEEFLPSGAVSLNSTDLELVNDGASGDQAIGLRFSSLAIPPGAVITEARIQFTADEAQSEATTLNIAAEATDSATPFTTTANNLGSRARSTTSILWQPDAWNIVGEASDPQQTPNLAAVVQEIVSRPGWASGNALAFVIEGTGHRTADSFDKAGGTPARLTVSYHTP